MIRRRTMIRMLTATGFLAVLCLAALLLSQLRSQAQKPSAQPAPAGREGGDQLESTDPAKEIEKLKEEIQRLKAELAEQRRQTTAIVNHLTWAPEMEVQQEWCKDWYDKDYQPGDQGDKLNRVIRGGAWNSSARDCRVAHRRAEDSARSNVATGFRVVVRLRESRSPSLR